MPAAWNVYFMVDDAAAVHADDDALDDLNPLLLAFDDAHVHAHGIADADVGVITSYSIHYTK